MRQSHARFLLVAAVLAAPSSLSAQEFADFCPDADVETQSAIVGYVTDPEASTVVPGATVAASWVQDGTRRRAIAQSGAKGLYTLCGLPQQVDVQLRATFGDRRGAAVPYTTTAALAQQDLEVSLTTDPEDEILELSEESSGGQAFNADVIRDVDLVNLPEMSVYQLLRQHSRLRFDRINGLGEIITFDSVRSTSLNSGRFVGVRMYINERREGDPVSAIRGMSIDEIKRIDILSAGEASARYGGDGWIGAISITTNRGD